MVYKMDLDVHIKAEPVDLEETENYEIVPEMTPLREEFNTELTEMGQTEKSYELVPELMHVKEEFKSELTELEQPEENYELIPEVAPVKEEFKSEFGQTQENYELVPQVGQLKEECESELMRLGQTLVNTEPSADLKDEEEHKVSRMVPYFREENLPEGPWRTKRPLLSPKACRLRGAVWSARRIIESTSPGKISSPSSSSKTWGRNGGHEILNKFRIPAPNTGGLETQAGARAVVGTPGLCAGDISALAVQHAGDQLSSELETLASIQAELEGFSTAEGVKGSLEDKDLDAGEDSLNPVKRIQSVAKISSRNHRWGKTPSPEAILPDIMEQTTREMDIAISPLHEQELGVQLSSSSHCQLSASCNSWNVTPTVTSKNSQSAGSSIVVIQSPVAPRTSGVPASVSVSDGKISGLSGNVAVSSSPHLLSIKAVSADSKIIQLGPSGISKQGVATSSSSFTPGTLQATIKRLATSGSSQKKNVHTKVIITGNQCNKQGQPIKLTTSKSGENFTTGQPVKIISTCGKRMLLTGPTKAITLAEAQQLGLISPTKLQQIMPTSQNKQSIIVNKLASRPSKFTVVPASTVVKSPTKTMPAPLSSMTQLKPGATVSAVTTAVSPVNTNVKPLASPQKFVIGQDPGTLQEMRPLHAAIKRLAASGSGRVKNVYAKVIKTGSQDNQQGQTTMLATSQLGDNFTTGQPLKFISITSLKDGKGTLLTDPTVRPLGLISATKLQQKNPTLSKKIQPTLPKKILPPPQKKRRKQVLLPSKLTMIPTFEKVKTPRKILPAPPGGIPQLKPAIVSVGTVSAPPGGIPQLKPAIVSVGTVSGVKTPVTTVNTSVTPLASPLKVVICQGRLKPGTALTSSAGSARIRIPATRNLTTPSGNLTQLQLPEGRELQYVHLANTTGSSTSTVSPVTSVTKSQTAMVPVTSASGSGTSSSVCVPQQTVNIAHLAPKTPAIAKTTTGQPSERTSMSTSQLRPDVNVTTLPDTAVNQLTSGAAILPSGASSYGMLTAQYVGQVRSFQNQQSKLQPQQAQPQHQCLVDPEYWKYSASYK